MKKKIGKKIGKQHVIGPLNMLYQELLAPFQIIYRIGGINKNDNIQ